MSISKRQRFEVFKRDTFRCQYCGRQPPAVVLHVDHIIPSSKGGTDEYDNLVTACKDCNLGKSNRTLSELPKSLATNLEERREAAAQLAAFNKFLAKARKESEAQIDTLSKYWCESLGGPNYMVAPVRRKSLRTFLKFLPLYEVINCMDIALSRKQATIQRDHDAWQYFCGCCWKTIKQDEEF